MWLVKEIVHGYHGNFVDKKRKKVWRTTLLKFVFDHLERYQL